jgi:predicted small lipoprotein YifL
MLRQFRLCAALLLALSALSACGIKGPLVLPPAAPPAAATTAPATAAPAATPIPAPVEKKP